MALNVKAGNLLHHLKREKGGGDCPVWGNVRGICTGGNVRIPTEQWSTCNTCVANCLLDAYLTTRLVYCWQSRKWTGWLIAGVNELFNHFDFRSHHLSIYHPIRIVFCDVIGKSKGTRNLAVAKRTRSASYKPEKRSAFSEHTLFLRDVRSRNSLNDL